MLYSKWGFPYWRRIHIETASGLCGLCKTKEMSQMWRYFSLVETVLVWVEVNDHYDDAIMDAMASQITSLTIVYSTVYSDTDERKHRSSASLTFVWGIHRGPVKSPHQWPVTRKMFPFHDVIMYKTMMTSSNGNIFRVTDPLWGESTGRRWIPLTNAIDAELWCFLWSASEQSVVHTIETPVIWDAITLSMTSLYCGPKLVWSTDSAASQSLMIVGYAKCDVEV